MSLGTKTFDVGGLIEIPAQALAVHEILKGTFNDEIARVTALRDELAARQSVDQTLETANIALANAKTAEAKAQKTMDDANTAAQAVTEKARVLVADATAAAQDAAAMNAKVASDRSVFEASKANDLKLMDARSKALDVRETEVAAAETAVRAAQQKLAADQQAFNKRLDSLKVSI